MATRTYARRSSRRNTLPVFTVEEPGTLARVFGLDFTVRLHPAIETTGAVLLTYACMLVW